MDTCCDTLFSGSAQGDEQWQQVIFRWMIARGMRRELSIVHQVGQAARGKCIGHPILEVGDPVRRRIIEPMPDELIKILSKYGYKAK